MTWGVGGQVLESSVVAIPSRPPNGHTRPGNDNQCYQHKGMASSGGLVVFLEQKGSKSSSRHHAKRRRHAATLMRSRSYLRIPTGVEASAKP